jgi:hypothetical protein
VLISGGILGAVGKGIGLKKLNFPNLFILLKK